MTDLSGYTVKRLNINPSMSKDRYDIIYPDGTRVNVGYSTAHDFILGKVDPQELREKDGVFLV